MAVRLNLLRGFELWCDGERVTLPMSAQRLLAFLALHDRPVLRLYVAGSLWLDASEERSYANLRSALWRLRRPGHPLVIATASHLSLADGIEVDLHRAISVSREALDETRGCYPDEQDLVGELLPDWYEDWLEDERERLRQLRLHALEAVAERLLDERRYGQAVDACLLALKADPLRDSTQRLLVRVYVAEGNVPVALRQYRTYARKLRSELGLAPSEQMRDLVAELEAPVTRP